MVRKEHLLLEVENLPTVPCIPRLGFPGGGDGNPPDIDKFLARMTDEDDEPECAKRSH